MKNPRYSIGLLLAVGGAITVSQACEWNEKTAKRYDKAVKTMCGTIDDMAEDRDSQCDGITNELAKFLCQDRWNAIINPARKKKDAAALAAADCDNETLDEIKKWFDKITDAADAIGGITFSFAGAIENEFTYLDPSVKVSMTASAAGNGALSTSPYVVGPFSGQQVFPEWKILWDVGFQDAGRLLSNWSIDATGLQQAPGRQSIKLLSGSLRLKGLSNNPNNWVLDTTRDSAFNVTWNGSAWTGVIQGYFRLDGGGFWAMHLPATLTPAGVLTINTGGLKAADVVFPVEPSPTNIPPAIYSFCFSGQLQIGTTTNLVADELDPSSVFGVWMSQTLAVVPTTFAGLPWNLNLSAQMFLGTTSSDSNGHVLYPIVTPNDPTLIGQGFAFQGMGYVGGNRLQTGTATSTVQ